MKGIILINEHICITPYSKEQSAALQLQLTHYLRIKLKIELLALNPYQLYPHYTNPHALFFDLAAQNAEADYLIVYSEKILEPFISAYPARWILLKSYFQDILFAEKSIDLPATSVYKQGWNKINSAVQK